MMIGDFRFLSAYSLTALFFLPCLNGFLAAANPWNSPTYPFTNGTNSTNSTKCRINARPDVVSRLSYPKYPRVLSSFYPSPI